MFALPRVPAAHGMGPRIVFLASLLEMDVEVVRVAFPSAQAGVGHVGLWQALGNLRQRTDGRRRHLVASLRQHCGKIMEFGDMEFTRSGV